MSESDGPNTVTAPDAEREDAGASVEAGPGDDGGPPTDDRESVATPVDDRRTEDDDHLEELPDGSGCAEIWAHLADRRRRN